MKLVPPKCYDVKECGSCWLVRRRNKILINSLFGASLHLEYFVHWAPEFTLLRNFFLLDCRGSEFQRSNVTVTMLKIYCKFVIMLNIHTICTLGKHLVGIKSKYLQHFQYSCGINYVVNSRFHNSSNPFDSNWSALMLSGTRTEFDCINEMKRRKLFNWLEQETWLTWVWYNFSFSFGWRMIIDDQFGASIWFDSMNFEQWLNSIFDWYTFCREMEKIKEIFFSWKTIIELLCLIHCVTIDRLFFPFCWVLYFYFSL